MKHISLFFISVMTMGLPMMSQDNVFEKYSHELKKADVTVTAPESFVSLDLKGRNHLYNNINPKWDGAIPQSLLVGAVLDNDKEEVAFIYPSIGFDIHSIRHGRDIETELRQNMDDMELDIRPMINIITERDMSEYANADTMVIYEYKFQQPYLDMYPWCVGIYLRKKNHPALMMRIALSSKSKDKKDKYIELLLDNINYGDTPHEALASMETQIAGSDLTFPTKHRYNTGLLSDIDYNNGGAAMRLMQDSVKSTDSYAMLDKSVYNMATVERQPFYYGGTEVMHKWIKDHIIYPAEAIESQTQGKVIVEFIVDENGNVTDPQVLKGLTLELNNEAMRVVQEMPDWRPGKVKGEPVKTYYTIPITFSLPKE